MSYQPKYDANAPIGEGTTTLDYLLSAYPWLRDLLLEEYRNGTARPWLIIMRGLPGSGKSTRAGNIQSEFMVDTIDMRSNIIISTDDYWMRPDNTYDWNPRLLGKAHEWCRKQVEQSMLCQSHIILDNTNIKKKDYQVYLDLAKTNNYRTAEEVVGSFDEESCKIYASRNTHGVPLDTILRMASNFEP
jgi:predicted kinase